MKISYSQDASETIIFAAKELDAYLKKMLIEPPEGEWDVWLGRLPGGEFSGQKQEGPGGEFSGQKQEEPAGASAEAVIKRENDHFVVRISEHGGMIAGNNDRSVLLGVYDYLRRLGCRFLAPRPECEVIPAVTKDRLPADYSRTASFYHRGVCIEGADSFTNIRDFIGWLPKVGFNSFFLQFKTLYAFLARWYHHEQNPLREAESFTFEDACACTEALEEEVRRRGLMLHRVGHGWTGEVLGYQTDSWGAADRPLDERVRPLAAELDGVRGLYRGIPADTNLCYHSAEAVRRFAENVVQYVLEHPGEDYIHVWLADTCNNVCECEDCRRTTLQDQYVAMLNEIDRRLTECGREEKIVFPLYQELLWPPRQARFLHPERFVLMFAPISRTFASSYSLEKIPEKLPVYVRNRITLPESPGENLACLRAWQKQFRGDSFMYDYPLGRAHYGDPGYLHISRVIGGDIRMLKRLGLEGYMSCQELRAALPNALPDYVMGYTLFDETADTEALIEEYFAAAYGDRAAEVRNCLEHLSELHFCDYLNGKGPRRDPAVSERMKTIQQVCDEFLKNRMEAPDEPAERGSMDVLAVFWRLLKYHLGYTLRLAGALQCLSEEDAHAAAEKWCELRAYICAGEPEFQPYLDVYRVLEVTQNYTGFREPQA